MNHHCFWWLWDSGASAMSNDAPLHPASGTRKWLGFPDEAVCCIAALLLLAISGSAMWYWVSCNRFVEVNRHFEFVGGQWRIALCMSSDDLSRIRDRANANEELDVDYIVMTQPDASLFRGKILLKEIAVNNNNPREAQGVARVHSVKGDLPNELCVPEILLLSGAEIHGRIRR
jgi:hypothetical protein